MAIQILTPADFAAVGFPLAQGLEKRLSAHIDTAQDTRLLPVLGLALYDELLRRYATKLPDPLPDPAPATEFVAPWLVLRDACAPLVATVALGRYLPLGKLSIASHSIVRKDVRESEPADAADIRAALAVLNDDAVRHENNLRAYLKAGTAPVDFATWLPTLACGTAAGNHASTRTRPLTRPDRATDRPLW